MSNIKIVTDMQAIKAQINQKNDICLPILSEQILKDCNYFCKQDQGTLISSSLIASDFCKGLLIWDTSYAKSQYFLGSANKKTNANATKMWCQKAYSEFHADWNKILQKLTEGDK
ncbi:MAG: minor capsid protein [Oscillospiraceae bacterium]